MAEIISVRLEKNFLKELTEIEKKWKADRSEVIRRLLAEALAKWKIEHALERLASHNISLGKSAKECSLSIWEMIELAKERNIDWVGYTERDLKEDINIKLVKDDK